MYSELREAKVLQQAAEEQAKAQTLASQKQIASLRQQEATAREEFERRLAAAIADAAERSGVAIAAERSATERVHLYQAQADIFKSSYSKYRHSEARTRQALETETRSRQVALAQADAKRRVAIGSPRSPALGSPALGSPTLGSPRSPAKLQYRSA